MKSARSANVSFFLAALTLLFTLLFGLPPDSGQARLQNDSVPPETATFASPTETTPTPTDSPLPPSATPSPTLSPHPSETSQPTDSAEETIAEQSLLLIGLAPTTYVEQFASRISYPVIDVGLSALQIYAVQVPQAQTDEMINTLAALPEVRYAEPDGTVSAQDTLPNDPGFPFQYALVNIRAPQGWDLQTGSHLVTIAIVDSGVDLTHPELAPKILPGYDFVNGDSIPQDDNGHGTHVAGIAGAASNNGLGIAGVSWGALILPVKVLNAFNSGTYSNVAAGIVWATDHGAQIINLSLGGASDSLTLQAAVQYAHSHGVLMAAAAGNTGGAVLYPARYPEVIAVANTNAANVRVPGSAFGPEIDLAAPGAGIYSLAIGGGYTTLGGTSMSAPHVSGALALLLSVPGVGPGQARTYLEASALDIDSPGWDVFTGYGLIQLDAALRQAIPTATPSPPSTRAPHTPRAFTPTAAIWLPPVWTSTPLPTASPNPLSSSNPTASATSTEAWFSSNTATPTPTQTATRASLPAHPAKLGRALWIPCLGIVLILLGILLAIAARRQWQKSTI